MSAEDGVISAHFNFRAEDETLIAVEVGSKPVIIIEMVVDEDDEPSLIVDVSLFDEKDTWAILDALSKVLKENSE